MKRDLRRQVVYPHPIEKVWRAVTDAELLGAWLMPNDFKPEVGHRFTFTTEPAPGFDGVVHCEVLDVQAPHLVRYSWRGGPIDTVLTMHLESVASGTVQSGTQRARSAWTKASSSPTDALANDDSSATERRTTSDDGRTAPVAAARRSERDEPPSTPMCLRCVAAMSHPPSRSGATISST